MAAYNSAQAIAVGLPLAVAASIVSRGCSPASREGDEKLSWELATKVRRAASVKRSPRVRARSAARSSRACAPMASSAMVTRARNPMVAGVGLKSGAVTRSLHSLARTGSTRDPRQPHSHTAGYAGWSSTPGSRTTSSAHRAISAVRADPHHVHEGNGANRLVARSRSAPDAAQCTAVRRFGISAASHVTQRVSSGPVMALAAPAMRDAKCSAWRRCARWAASGPRSPRRSSASLRIDSSSR